MLVGDGREGDLFPAFADREAAVVEKAAGAGLGKADQRHVMHGDLPPSVIRVTKVSNLVLVACSDLATDSVDGQRGRPSGVTRLDLLKVVGSRPAFLARPDGVQLGAGRQPVDRSPDLVMGEHGHGTTGPSATVVRRIGIIALSCPPVRNSFL